MQGGKRGLWVRPGLGPGWLGRAGQGLKLKRRNGATMLRSPFPCTRQCMSHDARIGGDPDTEPARRFRIGGSYKRK